MVQVVGNVVAVAAFGEAGKHTGRMWYAMAALAGRNHLVLVFVAGYAGNCLVFCISLAVQFRSLFMAGGAHLVGGIGGVGYSGRHMSLVTAFALSSGHIGTVRFMTLRTLWHFAMNVVTETAGESGVLALNLSQLDDLLGVTGETLIGDIIAKLDDLGGMRVVVAAKAVGQAVVRFAGVALTTDRNYFFNGRWVTNVTVLTTDAGFVRPPIGGNRFRSRRVTLDAIGAA